jgi:hypothetical protein
MGLVEVVDVEDQAALRGSEYSEVAQVGIAASLDDDTGARRACEVVRHRQCRATVVGERGDRHASVADRQQF